MNDLGKLIVNDLAKLTMLIASGLAGWAIACLALGAYSGHNLHDGRQAFRLAQFCSVASDGSGPAFYSEMAAANTRMHERMAIIPSGNPDRDFAQMMIAHHQGAIDMALIQLKYGRDERLRRLAQGIIVEQGQEIAYMQSILATPSDKTSNSDHIVDKGR